MLSATALLQSPGQQRVAQQVCTCTYLPRRFACAPVCYAIFLLGDVTSLLTTKNL
jgi:hypothetical protein